MRRGGKHFRLRPLSSGEKPSAAFDSASLSSDTKTLNAMKLQRTRNLVPLQESPKAKLMTKIDLHATNIDRIKSFDMFPEVEALDLSCNNISTIENLDSCRILQELKLYGNKISIVENLSRLKELRYLHLQYNEITTLGDGLRLRNLLSLRLDHNKLTEIKCVQLCGCSNLRTLNVSHNKLTNLQMLKVLPHLEELLAANNNLKEPPDLTTCPHLKEIDLSANQLRTLNGLQFVKTLEILNLSDNKLTRLDFIGNQSNLYELLVSANFLQDISSLKEQFPNLEVLHLGSNRIDSWESLMQLKEMQNLVELELKGNSFVNAYKHYHTSLVNDLPNLELLDGLKVKQHKSTGKPASGIRQKSATSGSRDIIAEPFQDLVDNTDIFNTIADGFGEVRNIFLKYLSAAEDEALLEKESQEKRHGRSL